MASTSTLVTMLSLTTVLCSIVLSSASKPDYKLYNCRQGEQYYNRKTKSCEPCSLCTDNKIPHRQCYYDKDTLCLPMLKNFDFFNSGSRTDKQPKEEVETRQSASTETRRQTASTILVADEGSDDQWFTITMVLAGVLVIACVIGVILLFVTCYMCKKKQREIVRDSAFAGALLSDDDPNPRKMQLFKIVTET